MNRNYNFPWLAGVDIFILDYLYADPRKERQRDKEVLKLIGAADSIVEGKLKKQEVKAFLKDIRRDYHVNIPFSSDRRAMGIALYRLAERQMARVPEEEAEEMGQIFPWILKGASGQPKEYYDEVLRLPFEDTTIPVPKSYARLLTSKYGNFCSAEKAWDGHVYPFFEKQKEDLEQKAGERLPHFSFDASMLKRPVPDKAQRLPRKNREVLFLPVGPLEWRGMERIYEKERAAENTVIFVVPLPLMPKDIYGQVWLSEEEILEAGKADGYPPEIELTEWWLYDVAEHCPETIYIQNPYDETNPYLTVPADFYAKNLRNYTDNLVYVPIARVEEFGAENAPAQQNLQYYVTVPGVVYADRVAVQSQSLRTQYIKKLTEFAGKETGAWWEKRICVCGEFFGDDRGEEAPRDDIRRVLCCIGLNEITEKGDILAEALAERFTAVRELDDKIKMDICFYPEAQTEWMKAGGINAKNVLSFVFSQELDAFRMDEGLFYPRDAEWIAREYDAYYGSPSPYVPAFVSQDKPVMIADFCC